MGSLFTISGCPSLEYFRKNGATAQSTFDLIIRYQFVGVDMPEEHPILERKVPFRN